MAGASWAAALNTAITLVAGTVRRLRVRIENTGSGDAPAFQWQARRNAGAWQNVTTTSSVCRAVATSWYADGDDVPELLTGSGTYLGNNDAADETGAITLPAPLAAASAFECELAFQLVSGDVVPNDTVELRLVLHDGTVLDSYAVMPTITVVSPNIMLAGTADLLALTDGALTTNKPLASSGELAAAVAAALTTSKPLAGEAAQVLQGSATISIPKPFAGASSLVLSTASGLQTTKPLASAATAALLSNAAVTTGKPLAGFAVLRIDSEADLTQPGIGSALRGVAQLLASVSAAVLSTQKPLAGTAAAAATGAATIALDKPLAGTAITELGGRGTVLVPKPELAGQGTVALTALAFMPTPLRGQGTLEVLADGALSTRIVFAGAANLELRAWAHRIYPEPASEVDELIVVQENGALLVYEWDWELVVLRRTSPG